MSTQPIRAAIYARKSTEQRASDEDKSVTRQVENARAFAAARGWTVDDAHVYTDDGVSGVKTKALVSKTRMLAAINAKDGPPFQVLVMQATDRLSRRDGDEAVSEMKAITRAGVRVFFYSDGSEFQHGTFAANTLAFLRAEFAAEYRRAVSQKTREALAARARQGHVSGGACFGYDRVRVDSHVERRINAAEAEVVRDIYRRYAAGEGLPTIAHGLNERRVPCPRAQQERVHGWCPASVRAILTRRLYRGEVVWGRMGKPVGADPESRPVVMPESSWLRVPMPQFRIVDARLAEAVDARFESQRQRSLRQSNGRLIGRPPGEGSPYLLTGLLTCGVCGGGMEVLSTSVGTGRNRRRVHHYRCSVARRKGPACCTNKLPAPMADADAAVLDTVADTLLHPEVVERAVAHAERRLLEDGEHARRRQGLETDLREATAAVRRLTRAIAAGGDLSSLVEALRAAERHEREVRAQLADLKPTPRPEAAKLRAELRSYLADWQKLLRGHVGQAQQVLRRLVQGRLTFTPKGKHYEFRGVGTVKPLLGAVRNLASPAGFEPAF